MERLALATVLVLVIGQLVPRAIGRRWDTALIPVLVPGLRVVSIALAPLVAAARAAARFVQSSSPATAPSTHDERDALEELLREGEMEGVGDAGESAIISGVVEFTEKRARDVMTPRADILLAQRADARPRGARRAGEVHTCADHRGWTGSRHRHASRVRRAQVGTRPDAGTAASDVRA
jgi:CBS domain containing-hemolysin-like protein